MKALDRRSIAAVARLAWRDYLRTPEAVFWTYGFPFVMTIVLGLAFSGGGAEPSRIGVLGSGFDAAVGIERSAAETDELQVVRFADEESARRALIAGRIELVLGGDIANPILDLDPRRPGSELAELRVDRRLSIARGVDPGPEVDRHEIVEPGGRYVDFVLPGLIALNVLGAGVYGIGYNIVQMRSRNLFRRLWVTPVGRAEFLLGFLGARGVLALIPPFVILLFGSVAFGVPVRDGLPMFALLVLAGAASFSGLGMLISSRARTLEAVSGLMNFVMLPMWLLGGAFFSTAKFPETVQPLLRAVPLSWLCDGFRDALLGAEVHVDQWTAVGLLFGFGVLCFGIATRVFRWT